MGKLTTTQVRNQELAALGLSVNATADQINHKLHTLTPGTLLDNRTGLPYTHATAVDAGGNQALGQIVGVAGLGLTLGEIGAGLSRIGGVASAGGTESAALSAGEGGASAGGASTGAGAASTGASLASAGSNALKIGKYGSILAALADPAFALRIIEVIAGLALMFMGLRAITGNGSSVASQVRYVKGKV